MKKFLLFMLGVLIALPGIARDFSYEYEGQTLNYTVLDEDAKTCAVVDTGVSEEVVIPAVANDGNADYSVVSIDRYAFYNCRSLTSVQIPESVTTIGGHAFKDCSSLTSVQIPESVTSIEDSAFEGCSSLTSVQIPEGVTSIGYCAFYRCSSLTSVQIPKSVTSIGGSAFQGCSSLTYVIIQSILSINDYTFRNCDSLIKVACPPGLEFPYYYYNVEVIRYPSDAIIEDGFIYGPDKDAIYFAPSSLEGEYVIPATVGTIFDYAFKGCEGLTSVKSENNTLPVISEYSFSGLYASVELSIPATAISSYLATAWSLFEKIRIEGPVYEGFTTYETSTLKYMLLPGVPGVDENIAIVIPGDYSSLTEVTVPERITYSDNGINTRYKVIGIGYKAFNKCDNLTKVTFGSRNASKFIGDYAFAGTAISGITLPETVEYIGNSAFANCQNLSDIVIPGSVETIGNYAFRGCQNLSDIVISGGVETIGDYAFANCQNLSDIVIPGSVKTIGDYAFYGTSSRNITLNEGLETIGEYAFGNCTSETPLIIPSTLKSVGAHAFNSLHCDVNISDLEAWCNIDFGSKYSNPGMNNNWYLNGELITDLVIPESVKAVKDFAFVGNSNLKSVKFHNGLQSIGIGAFSGCGKLSPLVIPGNVTRVGRDAFSGIPDLDLTLAYGAEPIEMELSSFSAPSTLSFDRPANSLNIDYSYLNKLTVGNSVTEIPAEKFSGATRLTDLTLGNSITLIGDEAFSGCTGLKEVIVPPSVETIGASAFAGNDGLTSIIMGHSVKSIGEKAFDLCPAQTVSITAQTPPDAPDNTFSNYTGTLYVQGEDAVEAYYDADFCWYQFEGYVMIEPTELKVEGNKTISGKPGDTFQLTATLYPEDVTLPQIFWRSTNPDIATVDANGLVTLHADMSEAMAMAEGDDDSATSCKIIAESLYANGPVAEVSVSNVSTGVETIIGNDNSGEIDFSAPVEVYTLQGVKVSAETAGLAPGIYIVRQGDNVRKIAVK